MNEKVKRILRPVSLLAGFSAIAAVVLVASLSASAPAQYFIAHLSPGSPDLDVYVDGVLQEASIGYGQVGALRSAGHSGAVTVAVALAGTNPDSGTILIAEVILRPGTTYLITVSNLLEYLQIGHYPIDATGLASNAARIQVLHSVSGGPRMSIETGGGLLLSEELGYLEDPVSVDVSPGAYRLSGSIKDYPGQPIFDVSQTLEAGTVYTLIISGPPLQTVVLPVRFTGTGVSSSGGLPSTGQGNCPVYVVQSGDMLFLIALKFNTTVSAIMELNGLSNANQIYPGQTLLIPCDASGGQPVASAPAPAANPSATQTPVPPAAVSTVPDNFCYPGMPWEGLCGDSKEYKYTWADGYEYFYNSDGCEIKDGNHCFRTGDCVTQDDWISGWWYCHNPNRFEEPDN